MLLALWSCVQPSLETTPIVPPVPEPTHREVLERYTSALGRLHTERQAIARGEDREARRSRARDLLLETFREEVYPAWEGTPWDFHGTSDVPGEGTIACGHLLGSWLVALDFDVDRLALGAQASEHIIQTFVPESEIWRFRNRSAAEVVEAIASKGDGLYLLGLDFHAATLDVRNGEVQMCHASVFPPVEVVCEDALTSRAMVSNYRVAGRLFNDDAVDGWLEGRSFEVRR